MAKWLVTIKYNRIECVGIAAAAIGISEGEYWRAFVMLLAAFVINGLVVLIAKRS